MDFQNKRVIITGGSSGIGRALAQALLQRGARVVVCGRDAARLDAALTQLPGAEGVVCDLTEPRELSHLAEEALARLGGLDLLIHNAAIQQALSLATAPSEGREELGERMARELTLNLIAPLRLTALCVDALRHGVEPAVMHVTSVLAHSPKASAPAYCASKAGLRSATHSLRHQLAPLGIQLVELVPPVVDTEMTRGRSEPGKLSPLSVAEAALHGLARGALEIHVGRARTAAWLGRIAPGLLARKLIAS